jgi:hypothetical protein
MKLLCSVSDPVSNLYSDKFKLAVIFKLIFYIYDRAELNDLFVYDFTV